MIWILTIALAQAEDLLLNADLKTFFVTVHPYDHILMPETDTAQAFVDGRIKLDWTLSNIISIEGHHVVMAGE